MTNELNKSPPGTKARAHVLHPIRKFLSRLGFPTCPACSEPGYFDEEECDECAYFGEKECVHTWVKTCLFCGRQASRAGRWDRE
jgi:hypothetical protein